MKKTICLVLLFAYLLPFTVLAQTSVEPRIKRVEQGLLPAVLIKDDPSWSLEERMKNWKVPGLSVAVVKDFKVEWARSYGVKDIETKEPVTTETLFQAGSISKPVAAMVALKRVQEGKIALDENINNKLVTWKLPDNEFTAKKKVTLANLLSHTGGLTVHGFPGYAVDEKALAGYRQIKKEKPDNVAVTEARINGLGYGFLRAKKLPEAIAYFKLNVELYPDSYNVYDNLGEAYLANGDKELAIANYKKSLELNPKNTNATEALKKLNTQ